VTFATAAGIQTREADNLIFLFRDSKNPWVPRPLSVDLKRYPFPLEATPLAFLHSCHPKECQSYAESYRELAQ